MNEGGQYFGGLQSRVSRHVHHYFGGEEQEGGPRRSDHPAQTDGAQMQLTRRYLYPFLTLETEANSGSACEWSLGVKTEHSIANAYIEAIKNAKHFVYIENQVCLEPLVAVAGANRTVLHHRNLGQAAARQQQDRPGHCRPHSSSPSK